MTSASGPPVVWRAAASSKRRAWSRYRLRMSLRSAASIARNIARLQGVPHPRSREACDRSFRYKTPVTTKTCAKLTRLGLLEHASDAGAPDRVQDPPRSDPKGAVALVADEIARPEVVFGYFGAGSLLLP